MCSGDSFLGKALGMPTGAEKAINQKIQDFSNTMTSEAKTVFGAADTVFNDMSGKLNSIFQGGPSQMGWSANQQAATNAAIVNNAAAASRNLKGAAVASAGGGNTVGSDVVNANRVAQGQAAVANAQAAEENKAVQENFAQGNANYNNATAALEKLPGVYAESGASQFNQEAAGELNTAQKSQQAQDTQSNWQGGLVKGIMGAASSFIPGVGGAIGSSGIGNMSSDSSLGENLGNFWSGAINGQAARCPSSHDWKRGKSYRDGCTIQPNNRITRRIVPTIPGLRSQHVKYVTIPQPITSGSDQAGGGSPASTNIPPTPDAQNDAVKQSVVDSYPNNGPSVSNPNLAMPTLAQPTQSTAQAPAANQPILQHAPADNSPKASAHARLFDGILKTLSGGPVKVLQSDPTTGETREVEVPQSRTKMADSILAGVLSSLFTGAQGRGASPDFKPVMGAHGTQHAEQQAAEQAKIDQMQDRKMKVVKSNMETIQIQLASARMQHVAQQQQIDDGAQQVAMAKEYDQNRAAGEPQSIQKEGLTSDQALDAIKNSRMNWIAVPSGWTSHMDETGKTVSEPTYSIIDPHVKVKLTDDDRKMLAATNPQWANAPEGAEVPLSVVNSERLVRSKAHNVQSYLDQLAQDPDTAKALGLKDGKVGSVMTAAQDRTLRDALNNTEIQMAHGAGTDIHYSVLDALLTADGGPALAAKLRNRPRQGACVDRQTT